MQRAHDMTLAVHKAAASMLHEGITAAEVEDFIEAAHRRVGAAGSYFCIVLFGPDSAFPHGVKQPKALARDEVVLIDTGCLVHGYMSDITRRCMCSARRMRVSAKSGMWKKPHRPPRSPQRHRRTPRNRRRGRTRLSRSEGFGPGYPLPGLPHRTGHGIGLDIHEWPYLVAAIARRSHRACASATNR